MSIISGTDLPETIRAVKVIPERRIAVDLRVETHFDLASLRSRLNVTGQYGDGDRLCYAVREISFDQDDFSVEELRALTRTLAGFVADKLGATIK